MRILVALLMMGLIAWFLMGYLRHLVFGPPPEPEVTDVSAYGLKYVCTMCGLELKVEKAAKDRAPTHCGEKMDLIRTGGGAPLRPLPGGREELGP